jgi:hypothetical protein
LIEFKNRLIRNPKVSSNNRFSCDQLIAGALKLVIINKTAFMITNTPKQLRPKRMIRGCMALFRNSLMLPRKDSKKRLNSQIPKVISVMTANSTPVGKSGPTSLSPDVNKILRKE